MSNRDVNDESDIYFDETSYLDTVQQDQDQEVLTLAQDQEFTEVMSPEENENIIVGKVVHNKEELSKKLFEAIEKEKLYTDVSKFGSVSINVLKSIVDKNVDMSLLSWALHASYYRKITTLSNKMLYTPLEKGELMIHFVHFE